MPKRTNAFQSVIYLIKRHLQDEKAKVSESVELVDRATGRKREVDVCIETEVARHVTLIALECGARERRKQDIGWVEQMFGKHFTLPTDHLVLVSESGFTPQALAKAKLLGIETVTPETLTDARVDELVDRITRLGFTKVDLLDMEDVYLVLGATSTEGREGTYLLPSSRGMHVFTESHALIGTIKDVVHEYMSAALRDESTFEVPPFEIPDDMKYFQLSVDPPKVAVGDPPTPHDIFVEKMEPAPHLRRIEQIHIEGRAQIERSDFSLRHGMFQKTLYSWGKSAMQGKPIVVVVTYEGEQLKITPKRY